ncbi:MAG TPA: hypothetical protein VIO81_09815, partial [Methyloversatilis sp.]
MIDDRIATVGRSCKTTAAIPYRGSPRQRRAGRFLWERAMLAIPCAKSAPADDWRPDGDEGLLLRQLRTLF